MDFPVAPHDLPQVRVLLERATETDHTEAIPTCPRNAQKALSRTKQGNRSATPALPAGPRSEKGATNATNAHQDIVVRAQ